MKRYDSDKYPRQEWWPEIWPKQHDLRSAFQKSVVWYYQELAAAMESEQIRTRLEQWQYGNARVAGGKTEYWLGRDLAISAHEQVIFLERFHKKRLGIRKGTTDLLKEVAFVEEKSGQRLYAKTGTGEQGDKWVGWYVGWTEGSSDGPQFFALVCLEESFDAVRKKRAEVREEVLGLIGFR